jgi:hypothetical protein
MISCIRTGRVCGSWCDCKRWQDEDKHQKELFHTIPLFSGNHVNAIIFPFQTVLSTLHFYYLSLNIDVTATQFCYGICCSAVQRFSGSAVQRFSVLGSAILGSRPPKPFRAIIRHTLGIAQQTAPQ